MKAVIEYANFLTRFDRVIMIISPSYHIDIRQTTDCCDRVQVAQSTHHKRQELRRQVYVESFSQRLSPQIPLIVVRRRCLYQIVSPFQAVLNDNFISIFAILRTLCDL